MVARIFFEGKIPFMAERRHLLLFFYLEGDFQTLDKRKKKRS